MEEFFADGWPPFLVVACSGGGDSMALLDLACCWAADKTTDIHSVTIDHGLRDGSAREARDATERASALGARAILLKWDGWQGQGNLQDAARTARREMLSAYARSNDIPAVLLGHTLDDQAETFLMRLARGSGVEGLSGMAGEVEVTGTRFLRPLLAVRREALRERLRSRGLEWAEDPSNFDGRFDRVRMRKALPTLSEIGLGAERLAATSTALRHAAEALAVRALDVAKECVTLDHGDVLIDGAALAEVEEDTRNRVFSHGLCWVSGNQYRPRLSSLTSVLAETLRGGRATLHGCLVFRGGGRLRITREYAAVAGHEVPVAHIWDRRWSVTTPGPARTIRALGPDGLEFVEKDARTASRDTLLAMPSVWENGALVAVPQLDWGESVALSRFPADSAFFSTLFSH